MPRASDRDALRDSSAPKSDAVPAYHEPYGGGGGDARPAPATESASSVDDHFRRARQTVDQAQADAQNFIAHVPTYDAATLRLYCGSAYLVNTALLAASAIMVFFNDMLALNGVLVGSVTSVVLVISCLMIAQERDINGPYNVARLAEKYCLLLATAPGRAALVVVLGMLVVSCNWLGWLAFWVSLIDGGLHVYLWQTHPWFVEHADSPLLFSIDFPLLDEPPATARGAQREVAE
ncbi:hypothetical protein T492DRAFT_1010757 [Pavlovales sp. CCMP2436]|nr:hypothetical protein T492DRAFT_1010757 [Pavlovales sp. CCMP2436]|mmetsp:Transcript_6375/g.15268  ORF Transcript_6375/g.15268 Transcript_6375/m.15268 type:complete len:235 (+) Transcript_6375:101-805(+)